jgi:uncharacterized protein (TIGR00369 family)
VDAEAMKKLVEKIENTPYHRFIELRITAWGNGRAEATFPLSEATRNAFGAVHGGIYHTACDVASFIAAATLLPEDCLAVTSDFNSSVMAAVLDGDLTVKSEVLRKGKRNCYVEAKVFDKGKNLVVVARITKALVPAPPNTARSSA